MHTKDVQTYIITRPSQTIRLTLLSEDQRRGHGDEPSFILASGCLQIYNMYVKLLILRRLHILVSSHAPV